MTRKATTFCASLALLALGAGAAAAPPSVPREFVNPSGVPRRDGVTQVVAVRGGKTVYVSAQLALDATGKLVGRGDLRAQTKRVFENLSLSLAAVGASFGDLVQMTTYVVGLKPGDAALVHEVAAKFLPPIAPPASSLVGVQALDPKGALVQIDAVAVVP
jgi:enamine deaminase RidA (YjgF/YER057c/UK114 family)